MVDKLRTQLEFYLSDANLRRDSFFRTALEEHKGFVPLAKFLKCKRVIDLNPSKADLVTAAEQSDLLTLDETKTMIGRKTPFDPLSKGLAPVFVANLPADFDLDKIFAHMNQYGKVAYVSVLSSPKHSAMVEFESQEGIDAILSQVPKYSTNVTGQVTAISS
jgi:hypothetical protein